MGPVFQFTSQNMNAQNWKQRYSSLIGLGCIIEGPERDEFKKVLMPGMQDLLKMYADSSMKVREAVSWVGNKICEHHSDVVTDNNELMAVFVNTLCHSLQDKPRISV
jgi:hypothetical protein